MADLDQATVTTSPQRPRRRAAARRRGLVLAAGIGAVVIAGIAGAFVVRSKHTAEDGTTGPPPATEAVTRTDLSEQVQEDGTLAYRGAYQLRAVVDGSLTWLPHVGSVIRRGDRAYEVDGEAVPLLIGPRPFWRTLQSGMSDGSDVKELERNLAAMGYGDGLTVDRHFSSVTAAAIRDWQDDRGVTQTGTIGPTDVVTAPTELRVTSRATTPSSAASNGPQLLYTASGTAREVSVKLPVNQQTLAVKGAKVGIDLPGRKPTTGHVSSVGTVAAATSSGSSQTTGEDTQNATITVTITLDSPADAGKLDGAPVTVDFTSAVHKAVLAVSVRALLATSDHTYAVAVVDASGHSRIVPVELGAFADGMVEVKGALTEGMRVEVPRT